MVFFYAPKNKYTNTFTPDRLATVHCYHLPSLFTVTLWAQNLPFH